MIKKLPLKKVSPSPSKKKKVLKQVFEIKTILQRATPYATSALHVVRVSGPKAFFFLKEITKLKSILPRQVYVQKIYAQKKVLDRVVCFAFKAPASYTGEDMVEIQCHGSLSILDAILKLGLEKGLSLAEPGEFTQRAFLNGKITIEQAEAVDTLIHSKSAYFRDNALQILERKATLHFSDIKDSILEILSDLETAIEFPEDLVSEVLQHKKKLYSRYNQKLKTLQDYFSHLADQFTKGKKIDTGINVGILGRPNAGKSTLMNALLKEERVLVSEIKGTTRDFVKEEINLTGTPVFLYDTAGLRETTETLEKLGIEKTRSLINQLDIAIILLYDVECLKELLSLKRPEHLKNLFFISQADRLTKAKKNEISELAKQHQIVIEGSISLLASKDILKVEQALKQVINQSFEIDPSQLALLSSRQNIVVEELLKQFRLILKLLNELENEEILVEEFRLLKNLLNELSLDYDHDEVFGKLFSKFCIGK